MGEPQQGEQPVPPRSRLEDEVREILVRTDRPASFGDHVRRKAQQRQREQWTSALRGLPGIGGAGPGTFFAAAFLLAFLATLIGDGSPFLGRLLAVAAVASLAMVWVRRAGTGGAGTKRWRGRDMDLTAPPPAWVKSLQDRFRRPPRF